MSAFLLSQLLLVVLKSLEIRGVNKGGCNNRCTFTQLHFKGEKNGYEL
jgi:hypothetical protein